MRKVLIGCGVLVLIAVGVIGYAGYRLWGPVSAWHQAWIAAVGELEALDTAHPFDPEAQSDLDEARFEQMLGVRVQLAGYFEGVQARLDELGRESTEDGGPGFLTLSGSMFEIMTPMLHEFAVHLEQVGMGPTEFSWHTRVLWASLARVDAGVAGPELESLRGEYAAFRTAYEAQSRHRQGLKPLEEVLAGVPADLPARAAEVLARDPERVRRGLAVTDYDFLYLQQSQDIETLMEVTTQPDAGSETGAGAPSEAGP